MDLRQEGCEVVVEVFVAELFSADGVKLNVFAGQADGRRLPIPLGWVPWFASFGHGHIVAAQETVSVDLVGVSGVLAKELVTPIEGADAGRVVTSDLPRARARAHVYLWGDQVGIVGSRHIAPCQRSLG